MPSLAGAAGIYPGGGSTEGDAAKVMHREKSPARQSSIHYLAGSLYK
jgi:hypothetical protein